MAERRARKEALNAATKSSGHREGQGGWRPQEAEREQGRANGKRRQQYRPHFFQAKWEENLRE